MVHYKNMCVVYGLYNLLVHHLMMLKKNHGTGSLFFNNNSCNMDQQIITYKKREKFSHKHGGKYSYRSQTKLYDMYLCHDVESSIKVEWSPSYWNEVITDTWGIGGSKPPFEL